MSIMRVRGLRGMLRDEGECCEMHSEGAFVGLGSTSTTGSMGIRLNMSAAWISVCMTTA